MEAPFEVGPDRLVALVPFEAAKLTEKLEDMWPESIICEEFSAM